MMATEYPPLLTVSQAADLTGVSKKYLDKLRKNGAVRVYTLLGGTTHRFYRDDLLKHLGLKEKNNG
tara:strand:+ start:1289 stop:1486 length:198 start_codon:yes stop_codon:yes gene_type:complete